MQSVKSVKIYLDYIFPRARDRFRDMALDGLLVVVVVLVANICS